MVYLWLIDTLGIENTAGSRWLMLGGVVLCMAIAYLLGSINPAIIMSRKKYKDDIRNHGSGNAGATNIMRTFGIKTAIVIFLLDFLKAVVACIIGKLLLSSMGGAIAGLFVIVGHTAPVFYKFKGGKGVSCLAGVVLTLSPWSFIILLPVFVLIVLMSRYVSLGSVMCALLFPVIHRAFYANGENALPGEGWTLLVSVIIMAIVVFMHRANIKRIMNGTESKIELGIKKKNDGESEGDANDGKA